MRALLSFSLAAGIAQGLFLAAMLLHLEPGNRRAARILALIVLCLTLLIGEELVDAAGLTPTLPHVAGSTVTLDLALAPLLLLFGRCLTTPDRGFAPRDLRHFLPFIAANLVLLPFYLSPGARKLALLSAGLPTTFSVVIVTKVVVAAGYLGILVRHLDRFLHTEVSAGEPPGIRRAVGWYRRTMVGLLAVGAAALTSGLLLAGGVPVPVDPDIIGALAICGAMFLIGFLLLKHPLAGWWALPVGRTRARYQTSPLTAALKRRYHARLLDYMASVRPHLDMQLTLDSLASGLGVRPSHLSQVLNEEAGLGFHEFVNRYRVEEAKARIAGGGGGTLLSAAFDAGFNSKASFNRAFRRHTGMTPSEFARRQRPPEALQMIE